MLSRKIAPMKRMIALLGISLVSAALLGALVPALIVGAVGFVFPSASEMSDNALFFPLICLFFLIGPMAAGVMANRIAGSVLMRMALPPTVNEARIRMEARVAGILAILLSWLIIVQGSVYSLFDLV
jgi:hypothetical protein